MSRIGDIGINFANVPALIAEYEDALSVASTILPVKGKTLDAALKEQTSVAFFDQKRAEVRTLVKFLELQVARVRGGLVRRLNEGNAKSLGERMINSYIDNEDSYIQTHELLLEVEELYEKYTAVVEAFNKRGFALRDITQARIADVHSSTL
jgi:hypothetical protein